MLYISEYNSLSPVGVKYFPLSPSSSLSYFVQHWNRIGAGSGGLLLLRIQGYSKIICGINISIWVFRHMESRIFLIWLLNVTWKSLYLGIIKLWRRKAILISSTYQRKIHNKNEDINKGQKLKWIIFNFRVSFCSLIWFNIYISTICFLSNMFIILVFITCFSKSGCIEDHNTYQSHKFLL